MSPELSLFVKSLGMALLHSLWQGAAVAACLWAIFRLMPQVTAKIKYHFSVAGLLFMFAWFATTWVQQYDRLHVTKVVVTEAAAGNEPAKTYTVGAPAADTKYFPRFALPSPEPALPWFMALYAAGLLVMLGRFGYSIAALYRLRHSDREESGANWQEWLRSLREKMDIEKEVFVRLSKRITVPVVTGFIKPMILLPVASVNQLSQDQLEAILLHELAHIKRNDYLVNIVQAVIETILFFNPFMWRISAVIRREREHCCDDLVLMHSSHPLPYAMALATLETQRGNMHHMALAASGKKQHLFNRIKRIMEMKKESLNYGRLIAVVLLVTAIGISAVWLTPGFAQSHKDEKTTVKKRSVAWISDETLTVKDNTGNAKTYSKLEEWPEEEKLKLAREYAQKGTELYFGNNYRQLKLNDDGATTSIIIPREKPFPAAHPQPPAPPQAVAMNAPEADESPEAAEPAECPEPPAPVNYEMITREVNKAMKSVDWNKVNKEIADATKEIGNVDWDQIQKEINDGLTEAQVELNNPEVKKEIRQSIRIARRETQRAMEDARAAMADAHMEAAEATRQAREETRRAMEESRRDMEESRRNMEENRSVIRENRVVIPDNAAVAGRPVIRDDSYNKMLDQMNAEGLIDREDGFKIEKNDDRLYINGEEQNNDVYNKYKGYLKGDKIKIKGGKNQLDITIKN